MPLARKKQKPKKDKWPVGWTVSEAKKLAQRGAHGANIEDIPKPIIRYFDDERRRRAVRVNVTVFDAFALGIHYHVDMWEENNPILDRRFHKSYQKTPRWRECWDDTGKHGRGFHAKFDNASQAAEYVIKTWNEEFSKKTHKLRLEHMRESTEACIRSLFKNEAR